MMSGVSARVFLLLLMMTLSGCLSEQRPAPVTLYGTGPGAGSAGVHTVSPGETIYTIAQRYNMVMRDIVVENNLGAPFVLAPGQRLKLPPPQQYTARAGDSLYEVSRLFAVDSTEVARLNGLQPPYALKPGQRLKLPSVTAKTSPYTLQEPVAVAAAPVAPVTAESLGGAVSAPAALSGAPPQRMAALPDRKPEPPRAQAQSASLSTLKPTPQTPARASSRFLQPVQGKIVSGYGSKQSGLHNDGINIAAPRGAPVKAADNGVVVYAGNELKGSGNLVLIRHADRWMTAYAHMDDVKVARGQTVARGQAIGTVGSTGSVDSPQLHFEVRRGTEAINPSRYLES